MSTIPRLRPADLREIVLEVLADPERWTPHVRHDPGRRRFSLLHRDEDVEVWVLSWMPGHDTGFHDHEDAAAAIVVAQGAVSEQRLVVGPGPEVDRTFGVGDVLTLRPADIHRVRHAGTAPSTTIHAYSPPLSRTGQYVIAPNGTLQRHAQSAEDELRALEEEEG